MTNEKRIDESYEDFYQRGGWSYDPDSELALLQHQIVKPLHIHPGAVVLELGCGTGLHSWLLHRLGLLVTAIDSCAAAIRRAQAFEGVDFRCIDAKEFLGQSKTHFDVIFARGMSWFHYELEPGLNCKNIDVDAATASILRALKPRGLFVLQILTDFTGSMTGSFNGVRNHTWAQSVDFLQRHGKLELLTDWHGVHLVDARTALNSGGNLLAAIRKVD